MLRGCGEAGLRGFPIPGEKIGEGASRMGIDTREDVGEPGLRSTSLSFAVAISVATLAARSAPRSEPAKSHDRRPSAKPLRARSAAMPDHLQQIAATAAKAEQV